MLFDGWSSVGRIVLLAALVYLGLVAALRVSGPRALAQMSAYDLVVTIALGSLIATIPLQSSVTLADGFAAILTFLLLQRMLSALLSRWRRARPVVKGWPILVLWDGRPLEDRMRAASVTEGELHAALRHKGMVSPTQALAVVLENDGSWSVIGRDQEGDLEALRELDLPWPLGERERGQPR